MNASVLHPDAVLITNITRDSDGSWRVHIAGTPLGLHTHCIAGTPLGLHTHCDVDPGPLGMGHTTAIVPRSALCTCAEDLGDPLDSAS